VDIPRLEQDVDAAKQLRMAIARARQEFMAIELSDRIDSEVRNRVFGIEWTLIMMQNDIVALHDQWSGELCAAKAVDKQ
jgi:hypothetical protein